MFVCADIVSVLDIDWASLAKESSAKQSTGSLQKRFHPATVFSQIGISKALAGASLFDKVKALCEEGVKVTGKWQISEMLAALSRVFWAVLWVADVAMTF